MADQLSDEKLIATSSLLTAIAQSTNRFEIESSIGLALTALLQRTDHLSQIFCDDRATIAGGLNTLHGDFGLLGGTIGTGFATTGGDIVSLSGTIGQGFATLATGIGSVAVAVGDVKLEIARFHEPAMIVSRQMVDLVDEIRDLKAGIHRELACLCECAREIAGRIRPVDPPPRQFFRLPEDLDPPDPAHLERLGRIMEAAARNEALEAMLDHLTPWSEGRFAPATTGPEPIHHPSALPDPEAAQPRPSGRPRR